MMGKPTQETIWFQVPRQFEEYIVEGEVVDKNAGGQFGELWLVKVTSDPQGEDGYEGESLVISPGMVLFVYSGRECEEGESYDYEDDCKLPSVSTLL